MNAVQATVELVRREPLSDKQQNMVKTIISSNSDLLRILDEILDLSRIEQGELQIKNSDFNPVGALERLLMLLSPSVQEKNLVLTHSIDADVPETVCGDSVRLQQVLYNLISNAIKFTDTGEVSVTMRSLGLAVDKVSLEFTATDTGIGIAKDEQERIFDPFVQVDSSISRLYKGAGLGLAITRQLVELMGGVITLESTLGQGSMFKVVLDFIPVFDKVEALEKEAVKPVLPLSILLVEDEMVSQTIVAALLQSEGYQVFTASSGLEALDMLNSQRVDVILMDLRMPGLDGLEATERIRSMPDPELAAVKIIAFTGDVMKETVASCKEVGMDGIIAKPINISELNAALARMQHAG